MVDEVLEHIHHVRRNVVEGDGRITAAGSSIGLRDENTDDFWNRQIMVGPHHLFREHKRPKHPHFCL